MLQGKRDNKRERTLEITAPISIDKVQRWHDIIKETILSIDNDMTGIGNIMDEMKRWLSDEDQS